MSQFEAMYRRYSKDVYRFALWICSDAATAEDITSETFVRAWTAFDETKATSVKGYLLTIARHLAWKSHARAARHQSIEAGSSRLVDERAPVDERLGVRSELAQVLDALAALSPTDRTAVALRAEEDLSYEEIAAVLGLSVAAAKVRVHRARLRLAAAREKGRVQDARTPRAIQTKSEG